MNIVAAQGLIKDYNGLRAVDHVDFWIQQGECFGFIGPNGAGKTTIMRIICCYMQPSEGTLSVFGLDVRRYPSEIKAHLGIMPQDNNLDPDLNVLENLVVYARYFGIRKEESNRIAGELLKFVELTDKSATKIDHLSGGMKHRLLLARALVNNPDLLVLDEPTTGLDPHSRRAVWSKLNHLKTQNTTLLLTTHYMEEAEKLCDRVAIMDSGRIVAINSPQNLMVRYGGNLEEVYLKLTGRSLAD